MDVKFYKNGLGKEPVRDWLKTLEKASKKAIGNDIMAVQYGWPIGMPVVRPLSGCEKLWEVRTKSEDNIFRVLFTIYENTMILLHGFIKKSEKTKKDIDIAEKRKKSFLEK